MNFVSRHHILRFIIGAYSLLSLFCAVTIVVISLTIVVGSLNSLLQCNHHCIVVGSLIPFYSVSIVALRTIVLLGLD